MIYLYTYICDKDEFDMFKINVHEAMKDEIVLGEISSVSAIRINVNQPSLKRYAKEEEKVFKIITGHKNGYVIL